MIAHFAIVRDNASRWNRDQICQLQECDEAGDNDWTYSKCLNYRVYGAGKLIVSEVMTVQLDVVEDVQAEIDSCNELIAAAHREFADKLDYALEPIKARRTELMQISHQSKPDLEEVELPDDIVDQLEDALSGKDDQWTTEGESDEHDGL